MTQKFEPGLRRRSVLASLLMTPRVQTPELQSVILPYMTAFQPLHWGTVCWHQSLFSETPCFTFTGWHRGVYRYSHSLLFATNWFKVTPALSNEWETERVSTTRSLPCTLPVNLWALYSVRQCIAGPLCLTECDCELSAHTLADTSASGEILRL